MCSLLILLSAKLYSLNWKVRCTHDNVLLGFGPSAPKIETVCFSEMLESTDESA
jgi:hypothetical protein